MLAIGQAATERASLLGELIQTEARERQRLSEHLHDGALQYVLAARQDLEDLPADVDPGTRERLEHALREAAALLREQVTEMNPAVLEQAGLSAAVARLGEDAAARGHFEFTADVGEEPSVERGPLDALLYDTARELLANVVKHAGAAHVQLLLRRHEAGWMLRVTDDGRGLDPAALADRLAAGHIGLASRRIRLEAAGGSLTVRSGAEAGTSVTALVPVAVAGE